MDERWYRFLVPVALAALAITCLVVFVVMAPMEIESSPGPPSGESGDSSIAIPAALIAAGAGLLAGLTGVVQLIRHRREPDNVVGFVATFAGGAAIAGVILWTILLIAGGVSGGT